MKAMRGAVVTAALSLAVIGCSEEKVTVATEWDLVDVDGRHLEIVVWVGSGSCNEFRSIRLNESSSVELTAQVDVTQEADCTDDLITETRTVELDSELGDRALLGCRPSDTAATSDIDDVRDCSLTGRS